MEDDSIHGTSQLEASEHPYEEDDGEEELFEELWGPGDDEEEEEGEEGDHLEGVEEEQGGEGEAPAPSTAHEEEEEDYEDEEGEDDDEYEAPLPQISFQSIPRNSDGKIDMKKLSLEQKKVFNATMMSLLTEDQMERYECYRRTSVKEPIRRLIQVMIGGNPKNQDKPVIALAGITKIFVGELIEEARRIATRQNYRGPLQPAHIHASYAVLRDKGLVESDPPQSKDTLLL